MEQIGSGDGMSAFLRQQNKMLEEMNTRMADLSNTMLGFAQQQNQVAEATKRAEEAEKALNKELVTREEVLKEAFKILGQGGQEVKKFEVFSKKSFDAFIDAGGNAFDFFDLVLSSANQRVKIFGVEAALARKVMYGFLPPGMFRLVNKISTGFRFLGGIFRKTSAEGENIDNVFKKLIRGMISISSFNKIVGTPFKKLFTKPEMVETKGDGDDIFQGLFDMTKSQAKKAGGTGKGKGILSNIEMLKIEAKERRKARMASVKAFFKSKRWKEVGSVVYKFGKTILTNLGKFLFMAMLYMVLITIAISLLREPIKQALEFASELAGKVLPIITAGFSSIFDGVVGIYQSLMSGDILGIIEGFWTIVWGVLQVVFGLASAAFFTLLGFVVGFGLKVLEKGKDFIVDFLNFRGTIKDNLKRIIVIGVAVLAFIYGFPAIIAIAAVTALVMLVKMIGKAIKSAFGFNEKGGLVTKDVTVVGERGPELVSLPSGSRVHSNSNSKRMAGSSGVVNNFNITINAKDTSKAEMRRIADEIGRMVSSKINRRTSNRSSV